MKKVIEGEAKETTIRMPKRQWDLLFSDACKATKKEGKIVSVPEIMRRIIWLHYAKRRVKSKKVR